jgi:hypothetical protein
MLSGATVDEVNGGAVETSPSTLERQGHGKAFSRGRVTVENEIVPSAEADSIWDSR